MSEIKNFIGSERFLCFNLGKEEYAIPLLAVREVIAKPDFTPIPFTPPHFLGIMNLRGQVISVIDLRLKFGIKSQNAFETAVIICDLGSFSMGIVVDTINSVLAVAEGEVLEKPQIQSQKSTDYISGIYRKESQLVLFLDIAKSLDVQDQAAIAKATASNKAS